MKRNCVVTVVVMVLGCFLGNNIHADLRKDMKTVLEKHGPGEEVAVYGKMVPSSALGEWKKAQKALKDARISLRKAIGKAEMVDQVPEWATRLSGRLDALTEDFNNLVLDNRSRHEGQDLKNQVAMELIMTLSKEIGKVHGELLNLEKELTKKMNRDEGWSFGVAAYGSTEYATSTRVLMPIGGAGLMASFRKEKMVLDLLIGAGVSVVGYTSVSWTFIPSLQFLIKNNFSVGPAMVLTQDLGNMEGADRLVWQAGVKLKKGFGKMNIWAVPSFGVHGERGQGAEGPKYSPNVGITVGVDYGILK